MKNKSIFFLTIVFLFIVFVTSCNSNNSKHKKNEQNSYENVVYKPGEFVYNINCRTDQSESYAAYFPISYNLNSEFPVIIVFDAHARGKMAVHKFKMAADEFGYIIIASNNAKNGLKTINKTINALFDDVFFRFKIDEKRVYTAGFSGGAKVASSVAIYKGGISGVLAIAGGLPKVGQEINKLFNYASIVGIEDFNYIELRSLDKQMNEIGFPHKLSISKIGHKWPTEKILRNSIEWFQIMEMKNGIIPVNDNLVRNYTQNTADSINILLLKGQVYRAKILYEQFLALINGLYDVSSYQKSYEVLLKNPNIKSQQTQIELSDKQESEKQQVYINLFKTQSFSVLVREVNLLNANLTSKNELKKNSSKRLLNYMSMLSYIFTDGAVKNADYKLAEKYLSIYKKVDVDNPDMYYFSACIFAKMANEKEAISKLKKAVEFGFFDLNRLKSEYCLKEIEKLAEFDDIVRKAKENFELF